MAPGWVFLSRMASATVDRVRSTPVRRFGLPRSTRLAWGRADGPTPLRERIGILFRSVSGSSGLRPGTPQARTGWAGMRVWNVQRIGTGTVPEHFGAGANCWLNAAPECFAPSVTGVFGGMHGRRRFGSVRAFVERVCFGCGPMTAVSISRVVPRRL